jgi:hypothetical protein
MKLFQLLRAILREIFDEAAYERFCESEQMQPGRRAYSSFLRRTERATKIRCC